MPPTSTPEPGPTLAWLSDVRGPARVYKGGRQQGGAKGSPCLCCFPARVKGERVELGYGVDISLCAAHRDPRFIATRNGRDFIAAVGALLGSAGIQSRRRQLALTRFVRTAQRQLRPVARSQPGSYAWGGLRTAVEGRWAAGATFREGQALVEQACARAPKGMRAPTPNTIRRWWRDQRWLDRAPPPQPPEPLVDRRRSLRPLTPRSSQGALHGRPPARVPAPLAAEPVNATAERDMFPRPPRGPHPGGAGARAP